MCNVLGEDKRFSAMPQPRFCVMLGGSFLAGVMIGLAWRIQDLGLLGIPGLGCFLLIQALTKGYRYASGLACFSGTVAYLIACSWLTYTIGYLIHVTDFWSTLLTLPVCVIQGGHYVLFAVTWLYVRRKSRYGFFLAPLIWVLTQSIWPGLFPCKNGCLLVDCLPLCQVAELGGVYLVSLLGTCMSFVLTVSFFALFNRRITKRISYRDTKLAYWGYIGSTILIAVIAFSWGESRCNEIAQQIGRYHRTKLHLLLVQANTEFVQSHDRMIEVSRKFEHEVDLIVWPECALGNYNQKLSDYSDRENVSRNSIDQFMDFQPFPGATVPLLAGGKTWLSQSDAGQPNKHFVSAMLFDEDEQLIGRHDKLRLMPYGETIPGETLLPFLRTLFGDDRRTSRGSVVVPIGRVVNFNLGVALCCEDMYPDLFRKLVVQESDLLISLGNGIAFDSPIALRQHFRIARMRAIENRKYFVRCTSHGVSGVITPAGDLVFELPVMQDAAALAEIPKFEGAPTIFSRFGAAVNPILIIGTLCLTLLNWDVEE